MTDIEKNTDMKSEDAKRVHRRQLLKTGAIAAPLVVTLSHNAFATNNNGGIAGSISCKQKLDGKKIIPENYKEITEGRKKHPPVTVEPSRTKIRYSEHNHKHWKYLKYSSEEQAGHSCVVSMATFYDHH